MRVMFFAMFLFLLPSLGTAQVLPIDPDGDTIPSAVCTPQPPLCSPLPDVCVPGPEVCTGEGETLVCGPGPEICTPVPEVCTPMPDQCAPLLPPTGDNCADISNTDQMDTDADAVGNVCDETPNGESLLRVVVSVQNDNGGIKIPSEVTVHVGLAPASVTLKERSLLSRIAAFFGSKAVAQETLMAPAQFPGNASGTDVVLPSDNPNFFLSTDPVSGYSLSLGGCESGTVAANSIKTCTITLNDNFGNGFGSYPALPQYVYGCTDPLAKNFRSDNTRDDGSCIYATTTGTVLGATTDVPDLPLPAGCSPYLKAYLKQGRKNDAEEVKKLQTVLNETMGASLPVTGYFGNLTKRWVKMYQKKFEGEILKPWIDAGYGEGGGLAATGYAFITTRRHINIQKCEDLRKEPMPELKPDLNP